MITKCKCTETLLGGLIELSPVAAICNLLSTSCVNLHHKQGLYVWERCHFRVSVTLEPAVTSEAETQEELLFIQLQRAII